MRDFYYYNITFPTTNTTKIATKTTTKNNEMKILDLVKGNPQPTAEEISKEIGLTKNKVRYHLKNLEKKNLIKRIEK